MFVSVGRPYWDGSQLFLFIIALGCLIGAAFWATVKERHAFLVKVHQTVGESAPPPPALAGPEAVPYEGGPAAVEFLRIT
jgi:hypothetical protein